MDIGESRLLTARRRKGVVLTRIDDVNFVVFRQKCNEI